MSLLVSGLNIMNPFTHIILFIGGICVDRGADNIVFCIVNCLRSLNITSVWALRVKRCQDFIELVPIEGFGLF